MKIIKLPDEFDMKVYLKEKELEKCSICPFCGETRDYIDSIKEGLDYKDWYGIDSICKTWYGRNDEFEPFSFKKLIPQKWKHWKVVCFSCKTCGAKWESDPYENEFC